MSCAFVLAVAVLAPPGSCSDANRVVHARSASGCAATEAPPCAREAVGGRLARSDLRRICDRGGAGAPWGEVCGGDGAAQECALDPRPQQQPRPCAAVCADQSRVLGAPRQGLQGSAPGPQQPDSQHSCVRLGCGGGTCHDLAWPMQDAQARADLQHRAALLEQGGEALSTEVWCQAQRRRSRLLRGHVRLRAAADHEEAPAPVGR